MSECGGEEGFSHTAVLCLLHMKVEMCVSWTRILVIGKPLIAPLQTAILSVPVWMDMSLTSSPASAAKVTAPTRPLSLPRQRMRRSSMDVTGRTTRITIVHFIFAACESGFRADGDRCVP